MYTLCKQILGSSCISFRFILHNYSILTNDKPPIESPEHTSATLSLPSILAGYHANIAYGYMSFTDIFETKSLWSFLHIMCCLCVLIF